ncbi:MAG: hypothetical protein U9Q83_08170, partial [Bacteroidota bacterium]|nr:hypothetical protein [Bacteroidota bacterium]
MKADLYEYKSLQDFLITTNEKIVNGKQKIKDFELKIKQLNKEKLLRNNQLTELNEKKEVCEPIFEQAKELQRKIELLEQKIEQKQSDFSKIKIQVEQISIKINSSEKKNKQLNIQKLQIAEWLENNAQLEKLNNDIIRISQSIEIYEQTKKQAENAIEQSNFSSQFKVQDWKDYQNICENLLSANMNELTDLENQFEQAFSGKDLEILLDKKILDLQVLEKITDLLKNYKENVARNEQTRKKMTENIAEKEKYDAIFIKTQNEIEIISIKIDELEKKLERENLEAKYEQDRLYLEKESPCPLCGSVHHPFAEKKLESKTDSTKNELIDTKKNKNNLEKSVLEISNKKSTFEANIENLKNSAEDESKKKEQIENEFNSLKQKIEAEIELSDEKQISDYYKKISDEKAVIQRQIKINNRLQIVNQQKQELLNISEKIDASLDERKKYAQRVSVYKKYFDGAENNEQILEKLKLSSAEYENNIGKVSKTDNEISTNIKLIEQFKEQKNNIESQISEQFLEIQALNENFSSQKLQLKNIETEHFNNANYVTFEKKLTDDILLSKEKIAEFENSLSSLNANNISEN